MNKRKEVISTVGCTNGVSYTLPDGIQRSAQCCALTEELVNIKCAKLYIMIRFNNRYTGFNAIVFINFINLLKHLKDE